MQLKYKILFITLFVSLTTCYSQASLQEADSLFANGKYTEAFEIFDSIHKEGQATEAMLLKMAFIKEGLSQPAEAIIYLSEHYKLSGDRRSFEKISELAEEQAFFGYESSDKEIILNAIRKYQELILGFAFLLSVILLFQLYKKRQQKEFSLLNLFLQLILVIVIVLVSNNFLQKDEAILRNNGTLVVSSPSAAGEPVDILAKGHKVKIIQESEVWAQIEFDGLSGYVRKSQLHRI